MDKIMNYAGTILVVGTIILGTMNMNGVLELPWAVFIIPVVGIIALFVVAYAQDKKSKE